MPSDQDTSLDTYIDAAAKALALTVEAEWKPAVRANMATALELAALFSDFELSDEAEPAPVFEA